MSIQVLVVENEAQWGEALVRIIETIPDVDVKLRTGEGTAFSAATEGDVDIAFIDLELIKGGAKDDVPLFGISLAARIRDKLPEIGLVLYSGHIRQGRERLFDYYEKCEAVADKVISRKELLSAGSETIRLMIEEILGKRMIYGVDFEKDLDTQAALEVIGRYPADNLIRVSMPRSRDLTAKVLGGGFSNAFVFRVQGIDSAVGEELRAVVKLSSSRSSLAVELHAAPRFGSADFVSAVSAESQLAQRRGWWALAQPYVGESQTLERFLLSDDPRADTVVTEIIRRFFEIPAGRRLARTTPKESDSNPWRITNRFAAEVVNALKFIELGNATNPAELAAGAETLITAVTRDLERRRDFSQRCRGFAMLHGDAHSRNILVTDTENPFFIDLARRAPYPRLFDYAALHVDIVLRLFEARDGGDRHFTNFSKWRSFTEEQYPIGSGREEYVDVLSTTIATLTSSAQRVQDVSRDEYAEALYFQLLRHLRFTSITYPKKCLAAIWSTKLLEEFFL